MKCLPAAGPGTPQSFNTVIPSKLITKLGDLGISNPLRYWIMDFLTNRPQHVRPMYGSNSITKFADDITVIGLISDNDESHYRQTEVEHLAWCADNNLLLNTSKTKELIVVDFRKVKRETHDPIHINGMAVEHVSSFKFLGIHISENLSWTANTSSLIKKAHQRLFFLSPSLNL
ncbi:hypothetical protein L3Q82_005204 [Scortum barcoo]|uniref:Uncharacterized protein n=1 Tax=Scortum barcoo TaxID=214431 RepID=A0ACB8VA81_9TELE|nr:hypothetical protein L3Q82_005204 [Scortum barcoo]